MKGKFITIEGVEGAGKSTHIPVLEELLRGGGIDFVRSREPGGSPLAERIRELLLAHDDQAPAALTELLLIFAARAEHLAKRIEPALAAGKWVLCDRFTDATFAYQGGGRGVPEQHIERLQDMVQDGLRPHLTLLFDAPVETGLARLRARKDLDRMETEAVNFFRQVRAKYLELAARHPDRIHVIDANADIETVSAAVRTILAGHKLC